MALSMFMLREKKRPAFTLIEVLVVAAIFGTLYLIAATVFVSVQGRQRETLARQRLVADGRYLLESIARTARLQRIDYAYYYGPGGNPVTGPVIPTSTLAMRDSLNQATCYQLSGTTIQITNTSNCAGGWTPLTPPDLTVRSFLVWISPLSNPYSPVPKQSSDCKQGASNPATYDIASGTCDCSSEASTPAADPGECFPDQTCQATGSTPAFICQNANQQPVVTVEITTESSSGPGSTITTILQTTISTRVYGT
jgi:prepilin-type N-terminal cleavage/methylation domain-containing protein